MTIHLRELKPGETGIVTGYQKGAGAYRTRLLALGLTKGITFQIRSVAPMGDPVEIIVRGSRITLRKAEADALIVQRAGS